jgi:3alpha(or 20beta)-hydroxysteroid dehydrogenase
VTDRIRLDGQVALITGAARGMGEATARLMASRGAQVVLGDILPEVKEVAASIGDGALAVTLDVTDEQGWRDAVEAGEKAFGKISILVNNAGVLLMDVLV